MSARDSIWQASCCGGRGELSVALTGFEQVVTSGVQRATGG